MGFYLKKLIAYLLDPLSVVFILLLLALWFLYRNRRKAALFFLTGAMFLLFLFSYRPFSYALMHPLESRYPKLTHPPKNIHTIVFLGGDLQRRGWEVLRLHQILPDAQIVTTGYKGDSLESEAQKNKRIFVESGIAPEQILPLDRPRDTIEEAQSIKALLGTEPFILVTAAFHMPRAMMIFRRVGLRPIPAPADLPQKRKRFWTIPPGIKYFDQTRKAFHEYLGILWLKIRGY
ncbi:ElyC/SanA/YdcF family protein [Nitratifractor sp.]|uniref:YdcF family protein n=1 Tax=Nitratifractor sp. TaxID=2268144 RepID=UPI0025F05843|nr:ElyC/SanA/YdcF family protein [Nitratifractor sp.]